MLAGATRPEQIDPIRTAKAMEIDIAYGGITGAANPCADTRAFVGPRGGN